MKEKRQFTVKDVKIVRRSDLELRSLDEYKEICQIHQYAVKIKIKGKRYDYVHLFKNHKEEDMEAFLAAANNAYWRTKEELKNGPSA